MSTSTATMEDQSRVFLLPSSFFDPKEPLYAETIASFSALYRYELVAVVALLAYAAFYLLRVVHKPTIYGDQRAGLAARLLARCPILSQHYWPTFWCWHFHSTTILRSVFQRCPPLTIRRQVLRLSDGGETALDWLELKSGSLQSGDDAPIVIILPGMTGSSESNYVQNFAVDVISQGCRPVVFNARGIGELTVTTPRMFAINDTSDLSSALASIHSHFPEAPLIGFGISYGGGNLTWYLIDSGKESLLSAAAVFSSVFDPHTSTSATESSFIKKTIYLDSIAAELKTAVSRNAHVLRRNPKIEVDKALKNLTFSSFSHWITAPTFGYSSKDDYYKAAIIHPQHIAQIRVPYVSYGSSDDKLSICKMSLVRSFQSNPLTAHIHLQYGGHMGFLEGIFPGSFTWLNRAARQFLAAIKQDHVVKTAST